MRRAGARPIIGSMDDDHREARLGRGRDLLKSAGAVLFVVAIVRIVLRLAGIAVPGVPLPGRPDVPDLPAWAHPVVNWGTLAVVVAVVVVGLLLARRAGGQRRK
jgi:cytochrome b561